jgi:hypothetical protein
MVRLLRNLLESIATLCSVNAYGSIDENLSRARWSQFVTTLFFSVFVSWNMKLPGNLSRFRLTDTTRLAIGSDAVQVREFRIKVESLTKKAAIRSSIEAAGHQALLDLPLIAAQTDRYRD